MTRTEPTKPVELTVADLKSAAGGTGYLRIADIKGENPATVMQSEWKYVSVRRL